MHPPGFRNFLLLVSSLLFIGLSAAPQSFLPSLRSLSGAPCRLSRAESERRCRAPGQPPGSALCHDRGRCECGVCICHVTEPGTYFGPLCECHEWICETYDGKTCAEAPEEKEDNICSLLKLQQRGLCFTDRTQKICEQMTYFQMNDFYDCTEQIIVLSCYTSNMET